MSNPAEATRIIEAALLSSQEPLSLADLKRLFDDELGPDTLRRLLDELRNAWTGRAVELVNTPADGVSRRGRNSSRSSSASTRTSVRAIRAP